MEPSEAAQAIRDGHTIRMTVTDPAGPVLLLWEQDGSVMSRSIAGWSAGVDEPVCAVGSDFLLGYLAERAKLEIARTRWTIVVEVPQDFAPSDLRERIEDEPLVSVVEFHFEDMIERGDNVGVCQAGNPAVNGVCGDPDCVCAPS